MHSKEMLKAICFGFFLGCPFLAVAQNAPAPSGPSSTDPAVVDRQTQLPSNPSVAPAKDSAGLSSTEYPKLRAGILILDSDWQPVPGTGPARSRAKHGFAPAVTYGIAPAAMVSEYAGLHAQVQVKPGQPIICACHLISLPGDPVLVVLHPVPKKDLRELHAGNLHIGMKSQEAEKSDLIPVHMSHPEDMVWLLQPDQALPPGEYALMLGTQNLAIFPFTVAAQSPATPPPPAH
jgi:hypothetical protein